MKNKANGIIVSIIAGSVVISASLVFLVFQISSGKANSLKYEDIEAGIEQYIQKQQEEYEEAQNKDQEQASNVNYDGDLKDDDAILGDPDAPVTIVEFSDYQCPYCRSFYNGAYKQIKEKYIDTGKVNFVYRDFPLDFHSGAIPAATAAECAREQEGDEMYYLMHDKIFEGQNLLGQGTVEIPNESLFAYAQELDLDSSEFKTCFESGKYDDEINADYLVGQQLGISGTPGFILNGKRIEGAQPFEVFEAAIETALSEQ